MMTVRDKQKTDSITFLEKMLLGTKLGICTQHLRQVVFILCFWGCCQDVICFVVLGCLNAVVRSDMVILY